MAIQRLTEKPLIVTGAAVYPYSDELYEEGVRETRFGEVFNMFSISGIGDARRILVPRNMAPIGSKIKFSEGLPIHVKSAFVPRNSEQSRVVAESVDLLYAGHSFIAECPPGFGKTACAMDIIAKVRKKTLVVVTKEDLRDQWVEAAKKFLNLKESDIGIIQGDTFQVKGKKLVVAMIHSLAKEDRYPVHDFLEFGLVIWDEVHRVAADSLSQSGFRIPCLLRLGLSATPDRKDGKMEVVNAHIGVVRVRSEAAPMTPRIVSRKSPWQVPLTRVIDPQTKQAKVAPVPHSPGKCGHVINMLCKHHERNMMLATFAHTAYKSGRRVLIQSDRVEHLETLYMMLQKLGVPPGCMAFYLGGMGPQKLEYAKTKEVMLATFQMTSEGTDIPDRDTLVMGTPKSDVRQILGRITRFMEDKKEPLIFDVIDSSSPVFSGYWKSRKQLYESLGAVVSTGQTTVVKKAS